MLGISCKFSFFLLFFFCFRGASLLAQVDNDVFGVSLGSLGAQFRAQKNTSLKGALVADCSFLRVVNPINYGTGFRSISLKPNIEFIQVGLGGVYYPFARQQDGKQIKGKHFKVSVGVITRFSQTYAAEATIREKFTLGGASVPIDQVGYVRVNLRTLRLQPILNAGYEQWFGRVGVWVECGTSYQGSPKVKMEATGALSSNISNREQLEKNLKGYRWYPVIQIGLAWKNIKHR